ncbi:ATP-binding protein [Streptomyces sp. SPB162]|uniref:ATP-binding protein n=1 Tax=Streptomyces sp. SPB162 TaxID=2940560 RepID=UPI002406B633|nr:ATP-binding protein [Streptomyces sp. SPB162]MDF9810824.1 anti-sigma regulatory factor (Ser/Thr protein kinase) [Streptomyces sp. SPB162]
MAERFLKISASPGVVGRARQWARDAVKSFRWPTRWRPDEGAVALVVSELVTNALRHAGGTVGLTLVSGARQLRIIVSDGSRQWPVLRTPHPTEAGGRGLHIVARLTRAWGVEESPEGKRVWADVIPQSTRPHSTAPATTPADATSGATLNQGCLSCSTTPNASGLKAAIRHGKWSARLLGFTRATLHASPRPLLRAGKRVLRKMELPKVIPAGSRAACR